jgi:hypothetical protein
MTPELYRPSNGTEAEYFMEKFCYQCKHNVNDDCETLTFAFVYDKKDPEYPTEWHYNTQDKAICSKFLQGKSK